MWNTNEADKGGGIIAAQETTDTLYAGVLTIHAQGSWGIPVGTAVLIAPRYALTVAHLFVNESTGLTVTSLLSRRTVGVKKIHFLKSGTVHEGPLMGGGLPPEIGKTEDEFVLLELDATMSGFITPKSDLGGDYTGPLIVAAETRYSNRLVMGTAEVNKIGDDGMFGRVERQPGGGFCISSGAPLFFDDAANPGLDLVVVGCHSFRDPSVPGVLDKASYLRLDAAAAASIKTLLAKDSPAVKTQIMVSPECPTPEYFHLVRANDPEESTYAGPLCFVKLGDLSEIDDVEWSIVYVGGHIGLLDLHTRVKTVKVNDDNAVVILNLVGGMVRTVNVTVSGIGDRHWLVGMLDYNSFKLLMYVFRVKDDLFNPLKPKRIHIELFDIAGPEMPDLPDQQKPVCGCPLEVVDSGRADILKALKSRNWDQDEIGNGNED